MFDVTMIDIILPMLVIYFFAKRYLKTKKKINLVFTSWGVIFLIQNSTNISPVLAHVSLLGSMVMGSIISKHWLWYVAILMQTVLVILYSFNHFILYTSNYQTLLLSVYGALLLIIYSTETIDA